MTPSWPQQVLQRTLRSVGCPACALPPRLLRLHAAPLPGLRVLGRRPLSTVTVRAQRTGLAEGRRAAPAASFAELGLGQDLLTFLAESRLGAPTEIQVPGRCAPAPSLVFCCTASRAARVPSSGDHEQAPQQPGLESARRHKPYSSGRGGGQQFALGFAEPAEPALAAAPSALDLLLSSTRRTQHTKRAPLQELLPTAHCWRTRRARPSRRCLPAATSCSRRTPGPARRSPTCCPWCARTGFSLRPARSGTALLRTFQLVTATAACTAPAAPGGAWRRSRSQRSTPDAPAGRQPRLVAAGPTRPRRAGSRQTPDHGAQAARRQRQQRHLRTAGRAARQGQQPRVEHGPFSDAHAGAGEAAEGRRGGGRVRVQNLGLEALPPLRRTPAQVKLLKDGEAAGAAARPRRPRALVLGPTRELTDQLLRVAKSMSHHARFRSACVNGGARRPRGAAGGARRCCCARAGSAEERLAGTRGGWGGLALPGPIGAVALVPVHAQASAGSALGPMTGSMGGRSTSCT
jgi:hypothetical protein